MFVFKDWVGILVSVTRPSSILSVWRGSGVGKPYMYIYEHYMDRVLLSGFLARNDALFSGSEKGTTVQKTSNMNLPIS